MWWVELFVVALLALVITCAVGFPVVFSKFAKAKKACAKRNPNLNTPTHKACVAPAKKTRKTGVTIVASLAVALTFLVVVSSIGWVAATSS